MALMLHIVCRWHWRLKCIGGGCRAGSELKWSRTWAKSVAEESSQLPSQRMLIIEFLYEEGESWTHSICIHVPHFSGMGFNVPQTIYNVGD